MIILLIAILNHSVKELVYCGDLGDTSPGHRRDNNRILPLQRVASGDWRLL